MTAGETDALIRSAIADKRLVRFSSDGCVRVAEPHDYGIRKGAVQLLVFQLGGESRSGKLPDWRWILASKMSGVELLDERFPGGRAVPTGMHSPWDQLFARVAPPDTKKPTS